jgi:hypothetical protein
MVIDWFLTACCLYGARLKSEGRPYQQPALGVNLAIGPQLEYTRARCSKLAPYVRRAVALMYATNSALSPPKWGPSGQGVCCWCK